MCFPSNSFDNVKFTRCIFKTVLYSHILIAYIPLQGFSQQFNVLEL